MNGVLAWLAGLWTAAIGLLPGFGGPAAPEFTGYIEAKYVYVAPASAGIIESFPVKEGQMVKKGDVLFVQTTAQLEAQVEAAEAQVASAHANWQNLVTGGRAEELAASQAAVNKARADLNLAQATFARSQKLFSSHTITQAQLDQDRATMESAQAALGQAQAQLALTALPAREEQQKAAEANYRAAVANAAKAKADLADRTVKAPVDGRIERTYYDAGEMAPAGSPVLALLPAEALKAEFYVPEADRMKLAMGQKVAVSCDGCPPGLLGSVTFLASDPQYTSPIIYSRDERSQLVFLAEATLQNPGNILPGQPVTVSLSP
jgi:HlyD family secretion protein